MGKRRNHSEQHQKWEQRRAQLEQPNNGEMTLVTNEFKDALNFGMSDNVLNFAKAVGLKAGDLRALKARRKTPTPTQKATIISAATKLGWALPANDDV